MPSETPMVDPQPHRGAPEAPGETFEAQAGDVKKSVVVQGHENIVTYNNVTLEARVPGAVIMMPSQEIVFSRIPGPIELRQQQPNVLDRDHERDSCFSPVRTIIELFGAKGIGKTTVLRSLAYDLPNGQPLSFQDGVVYCVMKGLSAAEVLFKVWSYFYKASAGWVVSPPPEQQFLHLTDISALLLLDDVGLTEDEISGLDSALPRSTVILSTEQQTVLGFGKSMPIQGLPFEYVRHLAEIQLSRMAFRGPEIPEDVLASYWRKHQGNPRLIVLDISSWAQAINQQILPGLKSETASTVLGAVQALEEPVSAEVLEAVVNSPSARDIAEDLARSGQLKANSPRYSDPWPHYAIPSALADQYRARALTYLGQSSDLRTPADFPLALQLLKWSAKHPEHKTAAVAVARKLSDASMTSGYFDRWSECLQAALRVADATEDTETAAWALHNLGAAALCHGELAEARANLQEALRIRRVNKANADAIDATGALLHEVEVRRGEPGPSGTGSAPPIPIGPMPSSGGQGAVPDEFVQAFQYLEKLRKEEEAKQKAAEERRPVPVFYK